MTEIIITDDHPIVRQGLRKIFEEYADMKVTGEAGASEELLELLKHNHYDVLLLDISLPGRSGLDLIMDIRSLKPSLHILMLSIHPEEQYARRALMLGASGYLAKSSIPEELVKAVRRIAQGRKYITLPLAEQIILDDSYNKALHHSLSNRELEVMRLLAEGNSAGQIAGKLSLSIKTISTYKTRILQKMNLRSTSEIIRYAIREGLVI